jgi:hypothetical protein
MQQAEHRNPSKIYFIVVAFVLLVAALSTGGWFFLHSRMQEMPPPSARALPPTRPIARITVGQPATIAPGTGPSSEWPSSEEQIPLRHRFEISLDPMQEFQADLRKALLHELAPAFPELPNFLGVQTAKSADPAYRRVVFKLLDEAGNAQADQRPAMLLAADLVAQEIWCPSETKGQCDLVRGEFTQHKMNLAHSELGGVFYYQRDLLWRIWQQYPSTDWGERTFILLLNQGWDTSGNCAKGSEQFREVIRQGESFLLQRTTSSHREDVILLVGQAYATWWSLSNETGSGGASDYVDPKRYHEGAEQARLKAIGYFEHVVQLAPETKLAEYARQILAGLREKQVMEGYKFFCIYD